VRETVVPTIGEAEGILDQFSGNSTELLRLLITHWWQQIGNTKLSGLPKLMMAEACNFPELAKFYKEEVIDRIDLLITAMLRRGIERGEIRPLDLNVASHIFIAPMIMHMISKHSQGPCQIDEQYFEAYLEQYIDMATHSLIVK